MSHLTTELACLGFEPFAHFDLKLRMYVTSQVSASGSHLIWAVTRSHLLWARPPEDFPDPEDFRAGGFVGPVKSPGGPPSCIVVPCRAPRVSACGGGARGGLTSVEDCRPDID